MLQKNVVEGRQLHSEALKEHGYEYIRPLGKGGCSAVFLVRSIQYDECFAVKVTDVSRCNYLLAMQEIEMLKRLLHPNIINPYNCFEANNCLYIVLEYCENGTLEDVIKSGSLTLNQALNYFQEVVSAVAACHKEGIAHRDIKASNVLIDAHGRAKLADFGIGVCACRDTRVRAVGCSIAFSPPEIFASPTIDPFHGDIWSLGVMLYYMIAGYLPWSVRSKAGLIAQIQSGIQFWDSRIPYGARKLIMQMTRIIPSDRIRAEHIDLSQFLENGDTSLPIPVVSVHQSLSSDIVLKFNTSAAAGASMADAPPEKKEMIKAFGNIAFTCIGKRRQSGVFRSNLPSKSRPQPVQTFKGNSLISNLLDA